jgi:hypothetical protein
MPNADRYLHRAVSDLPYLSADADAYFAPTPPPELSKRLLLRPDLDTQRTLRQSRVTSWHGSAAELDVDVDVNAAEGALA